MTLYIRKSSIKLTFLLVFIVLYLAVGATIFSLLEGPAEEALKNHLRDLRTKFLLHNTCINDTDLEHFIVEVIEANNRGVSAAKNVTSEPNWSFGQSLFFAGTILTTIGYGHVTPLSEGGKVFCIVYAAIGIPLTLIMFSALVERLMVLTSRMLQCLTEKMGHLYKTFTIRLIHVLLMVLFLVVFVFLLPSTIFALIETDWNFLDAFYYCFISMTTIGLGDYIPGDAIDQKHRPLYKICTTFYLFMGLIIMMLTLANIYDVPELNIGSHFYMGSDEDEQERMRLKPSADTKPKYQSEQVNVAYQDEPSSSSRTDERAQLTGN